MYILTSLSLMCYASLAACRDSGIDREGDPGPSPKLASLPFPHKHIQLENQSIIHRGDHQS